MLSSSPSPRNTNATTGSENSPPIDGWTSASSTVRTTVFTSAVTASRNAVIVVRAPTLNRFWSAERHTSPVACKPTTTTTRAASGAVNSSNAIPLKRNLRLRTRPETHNPSKEATMTAAPRSQNDVVDPSRARSATSHSSKANSRDAATNVPQYTKNRRTGRSRRTPR